MLTVGTIMLILAGSTALAVTQSGGTGNNTLYGTTYPDVLDGGTGDDVLYGYAGNDRLFGGTGSDWIFVGYGYDYIDAGTGSDVIYARDGYRDIIYCGTGFDYVRYDFWDVLYNCEASF